MTRTETFSKSLPLQTRLANFEQAEDMEDRLFSVIFTTGAIVRRQNILMDEEYDEELLVTPEAVRLERLNSGTAPVLDTHSGSTLDSVKGVVMGGSARISSGLGTATVKIDSGTENEHILRKIRDGIIRNVSIGYRVHRYEIIRKGRDAPLYRAVDWEPYEISLVPIGADAGAGIRSDIKTFSCEFIHHHSKKELPLMTKLDTKSQDTHAQSKDLLEEVRSEGMHIERQRCAEIQKITRAAHLSEPFAATLIENGCDIQTARAAVLDELARRNNQPGETRSQVSVIQDETDRRRASVENALLNRFNPHTFALAESAREYRGMTLMEIGRDLLERRGISTRGFSRVQLSGALLGLEMRGALLGTSDFPYILANVANKTLRAAYEAAPRTFAPFARQTLAPDFKMMARVQLGDAPSLDKVNESGEFKRGSVNEAREQYGLATYGKVVAINRQVIINDDLGAFTRLLEMFGRAAADLESDTVWGILTNNPNMGDGVALFHASHGNLASSGAAISVTTLGSGRAALRQMKGLNGRFINIIPKYLLVPSAQETTAQQFVTATNVVYSKNGDINPFAGSLHVIAEPRLDAASSSSWYLAGDPSQIDTIEYAYLEGNEGVYLESRIGFDVDGIELKARLDFAAKAIDWRGFWKNPGA
jgi:hypothetical protein